MNIDINKQNISINVDEEKIVLEKEENKMDIYVDDDHTDMSVDDVQIIDIETGTTNVIGGTTDHNQLTNRDKENQHPITAITGLEDELRNAGKKDELYSSPDIDKDTWYSFTGAKTLDGIKVYVSETEVLPIIDATYIVFDYDIDDFIDDYKYVKSAIFGMVIPYDVYISDKDSKHITIDLYNRGKVIIEVLNTNGVLSCNKFTVMDYLRGCTIECNKDDVVILTKQEETDPTVPSHVKRITQENINNWNNKSTFSGKYEDLTGKPSIPDKISQLENDSGFITNLAKDLVNYYLKSEVYTKEEINELASTLQNVSITIVDKLPSEGKTNVIYFVSKTGSTNDIYDEWIYVNNAWEHIGNTKVDLTGYATEKWVKEQEYIPVPDFREYMELAYYDKTQIDTKFDDYYNKKEIDNKDYVTLPDFQQIMDTFYYDKEEIDTKLEELPTGGTELIGGDNTVIEDNAINVYTNTGYKVSDKDIQIQTIKDSGTTGTNNMVYIEGKEITILYDGTSKIRRSENGIDFEIIDLPCACKIMAYNSEHKTLFGTDSNQYFLCSYDYGLTWNTISNSRASGVTMIDIGFGTGFRSSYKTTKEIISWVFNSTNNILTMNTRIASSIVPEFIAMANSSQFVWCNSTGAFRYGAGSSEGNFASLSGILVNLLKRVNNITFLGLKNNNKMYLLEPANSITQYEWVAHELPDICTLNDIIFNPYDETYYIFTTVNTYYKTKDFVNFESVDKSNLRGIQGYFTSMGIQTTTTDKNKLLLAPTRTKLENKLQEHDRDLNKSLWVGLGLDLTEEGKVNVKSNSDIIGVGTYGIYITQVDESHLDLNVIESLHVSKAKLWLDFDPYNMDSWFWELAIPWEEQYQASKIVFNQAGSFFDQITWEEEYYVEQYDYGYIFCDQNMNVFKYVKLGNLSWFFNKGE